MRPACTTPASFLVPCLFLAPFLSADDWPVWLGPTGDGISRETGWLKEWPEAGPPRLFEKSIGEGYSAIAVAYGHLILFHRLKDDLLVESLDPLTGKENWRYSYPTDFVDRYGYNGGPRCAPLLHKEGEKARVFTLDPKGVLTALDLATGKKAWARDLEGEFHLEPNFFGVGGAPLLDGDRIFLNLGGTDLGTGFTFALHQSDGGMIWKRPSDGGSYAAPRLATIEGERQLFVFHRGGLSCLDPADGREKWKFLWRSRVYESVNAATPLVIGDIVFFSATYGTGSVALRVKKDSYQLLWKDDLDSREKRLETHWSTAIHLDGHVYGFSGRHEAGSTLNCVELKTGKVEWRWPSYLGRGSMIYSDGHFIALGERGDLSLLKLSPAGHEEVRRARGVLHQPAWTPPILANGLLYLRDEQSLVCVDLRAKLKR